MHEVLIDVDVKCGGEEGMRDGQDYPAVESQFLALHCLPKIAGGTDVELLFGAFEAGGDCVDGVEEHVCDP